MSSDADTVIRPFSELVDELPQRETGEYLVDSIQPGHVVRPESVDQLAEVIRGVRADRLAAVPWGGGTQMGVGNPPARYDVGIDLSAINDVLRYDADDMTMSVQAGCRLADLNQMLGEHRQVLPVDAALPERATIGGLTAVGSSGPRRLGYGPLRDLIIGMSVMSTDGVVTKGGGQVVKNVTGFDMMRLHHGALGSLGIIVSMNLKIIPKPQSERTVIALFDSLDDADQAAREVLQSQLGVTALVVTNPEATREATDSSRSNWAISVRCEAPPSAVVRQAERVQECVASNAQDVTTEDSTDASQERWNRIGKALEQRPAQEDVSIRLGSTASKLRATAGSVAHTLAGAEDVRLTLDYGSGLLYARFPEKAVNESEFRVVFDQLSGAGDHITVSTAPANLKQSIQDVFGATPAGFSALESLKETFDPDRVLNPGRTIGKL